MNTYKLKPLHYISLPGYSFDCFLKLSNVELDTIQDEQILKDFISAMKGGICGVMGDLRTDFVRGKPSRFPDRSLNLTSNIPITHLIAASINFLSSLIVNSLILFISASYDSLLTSKVVLLIRGPALDGYYPSKGY